MYKLSPHEKLDAQLEEYKTQLVNLKAKLNTSSNYFKSDIEAEVNDIEKMLANVKQHINKLGNVTENEWQAVELQFKGCWNGLAAAINDVVNKSFIL
jgi:uncharacterized protein YPO0396